MIGYNAAKKLSFVSECKPVLGDIAWPDGNDKEWESDLVVFIGPGGWVRLDSNPTFRVQMGPDCSPKDWYGTKGL